VPDFAAQTVKQAKATTEFKSILGKDDNADWYD
jgi:hypothetical protein